jgi:hypothetical protein
MNEFRKKAQSSLSTNKTLNYDRKEPQNEHTMFLQCNIKRLTLECLDRV